MKIDAVLKKKLKLYVTEKITEEKRRTLEIETAVPLGDFERQIFLKKFPELSQYAIINPVNSQLIAGFIIRHESFVYDASLKTKIDMIANKLLNTT